MQCTSLALHFSRRPEHSSAGGIFFARSTRTHRAARCPRSRASLLTGIITLKGWERFQHYKDRDPPWVKLYRDLLTSESWVLGTDTSRLIQVASVLLAARYNNQIPYRWDLIRKVASLECSEKSFEEAVRHLASTGFLEIQRVTTESNPVEQSASTALATCASEAEQRQSREEQSRSRDVPQKRDDGPIDRVFGHWCSEFNHPKAVLDPKRRKSIQRALERYDEPTLCQAISGYKFSPHHMGQNEQRTVYDDIELFLRSSSHVEKGLQFARAPPVRALSAVEVAQQNLRKSIGAANGSVVAEQDGRGESHLVALSGVLR